MRGAEFSGGLSFYYRLETGSWRLKPARRYKAWLEAGLAMEGERQGGCSPTIERIAYYFVDLAEIKALHRRLLGDFSPTDVITLDYREGPQAPLVAEVFVCPQVIREMARFYGQSYGEELRRVMAHALLHLMGYEDQSPEGRLRMRTAEERWLSLWKYLKPCFT